MVFKKKKKKNLVQGSSLMAQSKESSCPMKETQVQLLGQEDPLEKEMATHSSILAWEIPWTNEPRGLLSMGLQRVRHDLTTEPGHHETGVKRSCLP